MIRRALLVGASIFAVLALAACGGPREGVVRDKRYSEGYYYTSFICGAFDTKGFCTAQVPIQNYSPPTWSLDIYDGDEHGWVSVDKYVYEKAVVGKRINVDEDK